MYLDKNKIEINARSGSPLNQLMYGSILINGPDQNDHIKGLKWIEKASEKCDEALLFLAILNRIGYRTPENRFKARELLNKCEDSNFAKFLLHLDQITSEGRASRDDDGDQIEALLDAAWYIEDENAFVKYVTGQIYNYGVRGCCKKDPYKAIDTLYESSKLGFALAKPEFKKLYEKVLREARSGSKEAQFALAKIYLSDRKKYHQKGLDLLNSLADQNYPEALNRLAFKYMRGWQVEQDEEKAIDLYKRAAIHGSFWCARGYYNVVNDLSLTDCSTDMKTLCEFTSSMGNNLGKYEYWLCVGYPGCDSSSEVLNKGYRWLKEAAASGMSDANYALGMLYKRGDFGIEQDYETARKYFEKCVGSDCFAGICNLAQMCICGQGGPVEFERGMKLFAYAKEHGSYYADMFLGDLYRFGKGVPQNFDKALELYENAYLDGSDWDRIDDLLSDMQEEGLTPAYIVSKHGWAQIDINLIEALSPAYEKELFKIASEPYYLLNILDDELKEEIENYVGEDLLEEPQQNPLPTETKKVGIYSLFRRFF